LASFARAHARLSKGRRRTMRIKTTLTIDEIDAIQDEKERVAAIDKHMGELFFTLVYPGQTLGDELEDALLDELIHCSHMKPDAPTAAD
jgi:hypothetical protein